jgi:hypothetical protein
MSTFGTQYFLGNTEIINSFVGDVPVLVNPIIAPPFDGLPLNGLIMFLDGEQNIDTASGYWYNSYGNNITASFFGTPTWDSNNGVVAFTNLQGMIVPPSSIDLRYTDYTIVYSGRYTGLVTDKHGRLLNSLTTTGNPVLLTGNWSMGLYSGSYYGGYPNTGVAWLRAPGTTDNTWIFLPSGSYDTNWRVFAGSVDYTDVVPGAIENFSSSFYLNGTMLTSSFTSSAFAGGPYGLGINTGSFQDGTIGNSAYENSNCEIADILVYNRVLNSEEILSASLFLQNRVGI